MHFVNTVQAIAFVVLSATKVVAIEHGDVTVYKGGEVKWQQLGQGMWTGIPLDEWDEGGECLCSVLVWKHADPVFKIVHKRSDVNYGLDRLELGSDQSTRYGTRSLEVQSRGLKETCQAIASCATGVEDTELSGFFGAAIDAIDLAGQAVGGIWYLLNEKPFITTVLGGTIATVAGIQIQGTIWPPAPAVCSTEGTDKDLLYSAISSGVSANPGASSVSVNVGGPSTGWTATMSATKEETPPVTSVGVCWSG